MLFLLLRLVMVKDGWLVPALKKSLLLVLAVTVILPLLLLVLIQLLLLMLVPLAVDCFSSRLVMA